MFPRAQWLHLCLPWPRPRRTQLRRLLLFVRCRTRRAAAPPSSVFDVLAFPARSERGGEHARFCQQRFEQRGRILQHDAFIRQNFGHRAQQRVGVSRARESSSFASRQSGLMAEKICLCLTCPAITARVTPSALKVSMSLESSPRESQCTEAAPLDSISGEVSSESQPRQLIPLSSRGVQHEKRERAVAGDKTKPSQKRATSVPLFNDSALRFFDEADQHLDIFAVIRFRL